MLHKCANSLCASPFRRLNEGKLFQVEIACMPAFRTTGSWRRNQPVRKVERYWLCDRCALQMTLSFENGEMVTVPFTPKRRIGVERPVRHMGLPISSKAAGNVVSN